MLLKWLAYKHTKQRESNTVESILDKDVTYLLYYIEVVPSNMAGVDAFDERGRNIFFDRVWSLATCSSFQLRFSYCRRSLPRCPCGTTVNTREHHGLSCNKNYSYEHYFAQMAE